MFEKIKNPIHPQVKDVLEVKGDDMGRVKNVELAHEVAQKSEESRDYDEFVNEHFGIPISSPEKQKTRDSKALREAIADRAIRNLYGMSLHTNALLEHYDVKIIDHGDIPAEADLVRSSYDELENRATKEREKHSA